VRLNRGIGSARPQEAKAHSCQVVQSALHDRHTIEPITLERRVPPHRGQTSSDLGHSGSVVWHSGQIRICAPRTTPRAHGGSPLTGSV
jgi:hypothetical protein